MKVKIKKLVPHAEIPKYAHQNDAGVDLIATSEKIMMDKGIHLVTYGTGLAVEIPAGYVGLLFPRSSICNTSMNLSNAVGVIDAGYRGEIQMVFRETNTVFGKKYKVGEKIGQLIIIPYPEVEFEEVDTLSETPRGIKGFGSSGK